MNQLQLKVVQSPHKFQLKSIVTSYINPAEPLNYKYSQIEQTWDLTHVDTHMLMSALFRVIRRMYRACKRFQL